MKSRRSIFKFLVLFLLSVGFFAFSNQDVKAQPGGTFCLSTGNWCKDDCAARYTDPNDPMYMNFAEYDRCWSSCDADMYACYSENAWQEWLIQYNGNIDDDPLMILNEPDPTCGMYPDMLAGCDGLPTAEEIEACVSMIQAEQAKFRCP